MSTQESDPGGSGECPQTPFCLFTIGYGNRTLPEFIAALAAHRIEYVIDVRSAPYSKFKPEFSKQPLEHGLQVRGIRYLFLGDLLGGQPADPGCYVDGKVDYARLQRTPYFQAGLERLKGEYQARHRCALMCSEGRPEQCHRSKLIGEALVAAGIAVAHIDEDGTACSHLRVIDRLTGGQLDLFGQPAFTSRKRYTPGQERPGSGPP